MNNNPLINKAMLTYKTHPETGDSKKHTDILINGEYIGYYINESKTMFVELNGEVYAGEFDTIKQLKQAVNELINEQ